MLVKFDEFGGVSPRYDARRLPMPFAVVADNCKMDRGQLRGFGGNTQVFAPTALINSIASFFVYKPADTEYLLQFQNLTHVVANANPSDSYDRLYWTEVGSPPQMGAFTDLVAGGSYPTNSYDLGVPSPLGESIPTRVITADSPSEEDIEDGTATPYMRSYTYTFVTQYGEESPPFVPTGETPFALLTLYEGDDVLVSGMSQVPAGNHPFDPANGAKKRVYQTDINGNFRLVAEIALADTTWQGAHMEFDASATMNTEILIGAQPPVNLEGLVYSRAGFAIGFVGNTLHPSSASLFHNFPVPYQEPVPYNIMGLVPTSQGVLVITTSGVYVAVGNDPSNLTIVDVDTSIGCVSKESIVDMGSYVLFASQNGMVMATAGSASVVTSDVILENDWATYSPETIKGFRHLHRYILISDTHRFVVNPKSSNDRLVTFDVPVAAGLLSPSDNHMLYTPDGVSLFKFDSDKSDPLPYTWKSATYINKQPTIVSCYKVDADEFTDLTMQVYIDTIPLYAGEGLALNPSYIDTKNSHLIYGRLPPFPSGFDVVVEFKGSSPVNSIALADSFGEFANE